MNEKDLALHKGLLKLLNDASFTLKVREVSAFGEIMKWVNDLDKVFIRKPEKIEKKGVK